jgi:autotransporter family porin
MSPDPVRAHPRPAAARALLALLLLALTVIAVPVGTASAAEHTAGGWTTNGQAAPASGIGPGTTVTVSVTVTSATDRYALVDIEVADTVRIVHQAVFDGRRFRAGRTRTFTTQWTVPGGARLERHTVRVGVFGPGWTGLQHWNHEATSFVVGATSPPTTTTTTTTPSTTTPPTTSTTTTTTTAPTSTTSTTTTTTAPPPTGRFETLPVGAQLPTEAQCAARVRPAAEIRPQNAVFNATRGAAPHPQNPRVTGNFTGTTDQILQWTACKWGIDEDLVRAQIARESWWKHDSRGDLTNDQNACHPSLRTATGPCPESYGLGQVRYQYHTPAMDNSIISSAYNVDYTYSVWRACFEGQMTWLNTVERGRQYGPGDAWGCIGVWFAGRWYTQPAVDYMGWVDDYLQARIWQTPEFINFRG